MKTSKSILVVSKGIPFESGGAASIIRNLFQNADEHCLVNLIGRKAAYSYDRDKLPYQVAEIPLSTKAESAWKKSVLMFQSLRIALKVCRKNRCNRILGIYRDESSLMLSYLVSLFTFKPLYIYLTDLYAENFDSKKKSFIQRVIFRRAKKIFVLNEGMEEVYRDLYQLKSYVIPHCVNDSTVAKKTGPANEKFVIGFAGTVVPDRLQLLQQMASIVGEHAEFEFRMFCPHDKAFLQENKLYNENVSYKYVEGYDQLIRELSQCDLLYLPLTFEIPEDEKLVLQLKSCLGTKSFDYLKAGSAILVQCPEEYLTYQYFAQRDVAHLLPEPGEEALEAKLMELLEIKKSDQLQNDNAAKVILDHDGKRIYQNLISLMYDGK